MILICVHIWIEKMVLQLFSFINIEIFKFLLLFDNTGNRIKSNGRDEVKKGIGNKLRWIVGKSCRYLINLRSLKLYIRLAPHFMVSFSLLYLIRSLLCVYEEIFVFCKPIPAENNLGFKGSLDLTLGNANKGLYSSL